MVKLSLKIIKLLFGIDTVEKGSELKAKMLKEIIINSSNVKVV